MAVLQNIMNPPGANMPERLSDLKTARTQREATQSATTAQNLQNAQSQVDMIGRSAQSMLDSFYPEGSEQPTNPTQAARTYFQTRKRLIESGVPENSIPEKVPTRSELEQARDQALSVKEQLALQQEREPEQFTLGPGETRFETGPEGRTRAVAAGGPEGIDVSAEDTFRNKETGQTETLIRTNKGLAKQVVDDQGQPRLQFVNSANFEEVRTPATQVNVGGEELTPFEKEQQEERSERVTTAQAESRSARQNLALFDTIKTSIEQGQAQTGFMGEGRRLTSQAMEMVGLDPESVAPGFLSASPKVEAIEAAHSQLVNQLAAERGARITNFQARQLKRALPELEKSREGNLILSDLFSNMARNKVEIGRIADIFGKTREGELTQSTNVPGIGEMPAGTTFNEAVSEYESRNPVLTPELEDAISNAGQSEPIPAPADSDNRLKPDQMEVGEKYKHKGKIFRYWGNGRFQSLGEE